MKKINIRKNLILILSITIVLLTIGFIAVSVKYNKMKTKANIFSVDFVKVKKVTSSKGSVKEPKGNLEIAKNNKIIDMSFDLFSPKDELIYEITLRNTGTNNIEIVELLMSPDYITNNKDQISPIEVTMTDIGGKILEPNEETAIKLKLTYKNKDNKIEEKKIKGRLGIISTQH